MRSLGNRHFAVYYSILVRSEERVKVTDVLHDIEVLNISGDVSGNVTDICYDSRRCEKASLFVAVTGLKFDGHQFITDAIARGARYVVHETDAPRQDGITYIKVRDSRRALGRLGKNFFHDPSADLHLIGVTGTNGKTTVTYLLESILTAAGIRIGVVGTVNYRFNGKILQSSITTPESLDLQRIFRDMVDAGVTHVIMEVSSHALDLARVDDCDHDIGIFTNLSQDHLDYHHTLENYFVAKRRYFMEVLPRDRKVIINADDPWGRRLIDDVGSKAVTFGIDNISTVTAQQYDLSINGIDADIATPKGNFTVSSPMIGKFNLYNILASTTAAQLLDVDKKYIKEGIEVLHSVPGRLQKVSTEREPAVFVDYAHTDDALKNVLINLSDFKQNRIITVFGCGGDRDRGKRPLMGQAAVTFSDLAIVTSDNPRTEEPMAIISDIEAGIRKMSVTKYQRDDVKAGFGEHGYVVIRDRREAIRVAVSIADPRDIILIAGKGHEDYQIIGTTKYPFDDTTEAKEALKKRFSGRAH